MPQAAYLQDSFLGGEWGKYAQGRATDPLYRSSLNVHLNAVSVEEGAWTRRPGTRWGETTRKGAAARIRTFTFRRDQPYTMEFTVEKLRFFAGNSLICEEVIGGIVGVSSADPAVVEVDQIHSLVTGEHVKFVNAESEGSLAGISLLLNRTWEVTVTSTTEFSIADPVTEESFDGSQVDMSGCIFEVAKVFEIDTPYVNADSQGIDTVQDEDECLILHGAYQPQILTDITTDADTQKVFDFSPGSFIDGPYLEVIDDGTVLTPNGLSGSVTLDLTGGTAYSFVATDVDRLLRLYSQPALWISGTTYATGDSITYNNNFYTSLTDGNTGKKPDISPNDWALDPSAAIWTWGRITAVTDANTVVIDLEGSNLLSVTPIREWRLGLYSDTTGWPYTGTLHGSRLWLAGAVPNRVDGSVSNGSLLDFTPTSEDGTVADSNACSFTLRATSKNPILWMMSDDQGVIIGTQAGEWLMRASAQNDPITPTSVDAKRVTDYGSSDCRPIRAGASTIFAQRYGRRVIEYTAFAEARFLGSDLARNSHHITADQVVELAYQQEPSPIVWAHLSSGKLAGCTYRRDNPGGTQAAQFASWHRVDLGNGRRVSSICAGPSMDGLKDTLMLVTYDPAEETPVYWVEQLTDIFEEEETVYTAWFVDSATVPLGGSLVGDSLSLYGLNHLEGDTVAVWLAGVDCGDYVVTNGTVTLTLGTPALLTQTLLDSLTASGNPFTNFSVLVTQAGTAGTWTGDGILRMTRVNTTVTGTALGFGAADWQNNRFISRSSGANIGYRCFNLTTGAEIVDRLAAGVFGANEPFAFCWETGYLHGYNDTGGGYAATRISPVGLTIDNSILGLPLIGGVVPLGGGRYSLFTADSHSEYNGDNGILVSDFDESTIQALTTPSWTRFGATAKHTNASPGRGLFSTNVATGYQCSYRTTHNAQGNITAKTCVMGLLNRVSVVDGDAGIVTVASITPQMIDPEWTHISEMTGCMIDESDGNVILAARINQPAAYVGGEARYDAVLASNGNVYWNKINLAVTDPAVNATNWENLGAWADVVNFRYVFKVNVQTGTVMWSTCIDTWADDSTEIPTDDHLYNSRCKFGKWWWYVETDLTTKYILEFDLSDGSVLPIDIDNVSESENVQASDDVTARLYAKYAYTGVGTNAPNPIAPTPATFGTDWAVLTNDPGALLDPLLLPAVVGYTYNSDGQILRPIDPAEAGTITGPALGKTRRVHNFAALLHNTQGISFSCNFTTMYPAEFRQPDGDTPYADNALYSGIYTNTLEDDYTYDGMVAWRISRPYPATVLAIEPSNETQDR